MLVIQERTMKTTARNVGMLDTCFSIGKKDEITVDCSRPNSRLYRDVRGVLNGEARPRWPDQPFAPQDRMLAGARRGREGGAKKAMIFSGWDIDMLITALDQLRPEIMARYPK